MLTLMMLAAGSAACASEPIEMHSPREWIAIAITETAQQRLWEAAHPHDAALLTGAMQYVFGLYARTPDATTVLGTPDFLEWWTNTGAKAMQRWAADDFPPAVDRDHLIFNILALKTVVDTPPDQAKLWVNGVDWPHPEGLRAYLVRIRAAGAALMRRGCMGDKLNRSDYELLRLWAGLTYAVRSNTILPCDFGLTPGSCNSYPVLGMTAPDLTLPTLESVLRRPDYTDAYQLDQLRSIHSQVAIYPLEIMDGYEAIPAAQRVPGGPLVRAKPGRVADADSRSLSASRGRKPVLLIFSDPIDGYWEEAIPLLEPLYRATKDRIDWYFIADSISDCVYWSDYYFKPSQQPRVSFTKPLSLIERAQTAKMLMMRHVNLTFPILLDDMPQHAENAYADGGGGAKVILIDRDGVIAFNNLLPGPAAHQGVGGYGYNLTTSVTAANVAALLDNHDRWTGKKAVIPDWLPPVQLDNVPILAIDFPAGTMTVRGPDAKPMTLRVDYWTRIVFCPGAMATVQPLAKLTVGMTVSLSYEANEGPPGRIACLVITGATITQYVNSLWGLESVWCPAIATSVTPTRLTAVLAPRSMQELVGLRFWTQAGDQAKPTNNDWSISIVGDWATHPQQSLVVGLDRATEVLINGMKGTSADIHVGDHLSIEYRKEQDGPLRRPFFIQVFRYADVTAAQHSSTAAPAP